MKSDKKKIKCASIGELIAEKPIIQGGSGGWREPQQPCRSSGC